VLVVDNDHDARGLVGYVLERCGARVLTASSGTEALALLPEVLPDVLLADIEMPDLDGYTLIRRIRALPAARGGAVPAAALTAYASAEDRAEAVRAGFQQHLVKPIQPDELVRMVAALARAPRLAD
jgi:CheY-like chemotaxis protein